MEAVLQRESLPWTDRFEVGVPVLDADHRRLVEAINAFCDAEAEGEPRANLLGLLKRLSDLAEAHFEREEAVIDMIRNGSLVRQGSVASAEANDVLLGPNHAEAHEREHTVRLAQLNAVRARIESSAPRDREEALGAELIDWFVQQAVGFDAQIRAFFMD